MDLSSEDLLKEFTEFLKEKRLGGRTRLAARQLNTAVAKNPGRAALGAAAPAALYGVGSLMQGDLAQGLGEIGGGVVGERFARGPAAAAQAVVGRMGLPGKLAAPLVGMGVRAAGGLLGGAVTGGLTSAAAGGLGGAVENVKDFIVNQQRESGKSVGGTGVGEYSPAELAQAKELIRLAGLDIPVEQYKALMPLANQMKDRDMQRTMQLNQQLGQLTGALNRQQYTAQMALGAQSEAGANLRTMMTSNPYASSVFRG